MSKTIRVIDLLNKIANGEEVPKKIKHWKEEYERDESGFIRYESKTERNLCLDLVQCLNDEVEIIEEQDIDIQSIEEIEPAMNGNACVIDNKTWTLNQVIKAVKQLDKKIKEK